MSHVPFEYAVAATVVVTVVASLPLSVLPIPYKGDILVGIFITAYLAYCYSPLPRGPHAPHHKRRVPSWGFSVEYEDGPQKSLNDYGGEND